MKKQTCCFTGHRTIPSGQIDTIAARTESKVRELILDQGVRYFGVGGAIGYDTLVALMLFRLRETTFPQIKVILVYPFEGFTSRWTVEQKTAYTQMLLQYDKRTCIATEGSRDAYLARNRHLVDCSSHCICFCSKNSGGTAYTVRYALRQGVAVHNVANCDVS